LSYIVVLVGDLGGHDDLLGVGHRLSVFCRAAGNAALGFRRA
jgi:hypothetical protein